MSPPDKPVMTDGRDERGGYSMGRAQAKKEIAQLRSELKASYRQSDSRLLKMALVLIILAVAAGWMYGRIHLQLF